MYFVMTCHTYYLVDKYVNADMETNNNKSVVHTNLIEGIHTQQAHPLYV